jgi:hypothetical protein
MKWHATGGDEDASVCNIVEDEEVIGDQSAVVGGSNLGGCNDFPRIGRLLLRGRESEIHALGKVYTVRVSNIRDMMVFGFTCPKSSPHLI